MKKLLAAIITTSLLSTPALSADKVLAVVNGKEITEKQLNEAIKDLPPNYQNLKGKPEFRKMLLENLVKEELLFQQARREGIEKEPEVQRKIELAKRRIIIQALLEKHVKPGKVQVSEKEALDFYNKNRAQFRDANGKQIPFNSLRPFIVQSLKQKKEEEALRRAINSYISTLEKKAKVEFRTK